MLNKSTFKTKSIEVIAIIVIFCVLAIISIGANIFNGEIVAPMDLLLSFNGWNSIGLELQLKNPERSDILDKWLPEWIYAREQIISGKVPLWNPLGAGGAPSLPLLTNAFITPGFLLFLLFGNGLGFTLALWSKYVISGIGAYLLCRTRLSPIPSLFGGISYMLCGFNVAWLPWPQVSTSMWIPWFLWALVYMLQKPSFRRSIYVSIFTALMLLGGFPSVAAFGLYVGMIYGIIWLYGEIKKSSTTQEIFRGSSLTILGVIFGFGLSAFQILPLLEFLNQFDLSYRKGGSVMRLNDLILMWNPFVNGTPRTETLSNIGIIGVILVCLNIIIIFIRRKTDFRAISTWFYFWVIIAIISAMIVYRIPETLMDYLCGYIPVLSSNPNNRLVVILLLSLVILGSTVLELLIKWLNIFVKSLKMKKFAYIICLILILIQFFDLSRANRSVNSVVPSESFYPETKTIKYVKENILQGQSVIADKNFMVSGTLNAYGIQDWFAHGFHTNNEKEVLNNIVNKPWVTQTAAHFDLYKVRELSSPWFDALGIKYVLGDKDLTRKIILEQTKNDKPAPPLPMHKLKQKIHINNSTVISGVELLLATYGRSTAGIDVDLTIQNEKGEELVKSSIKGDNIKDNSWIEFNFSKELKLLSGTYYIIIQSEDNNKNLPVTVWTNSVPKEDDNYLIVDDVEQEGTSMAFRLFGSKITGWRYKTLEDNISINERLDGPPGAYFINNKSINNSEPSSDLMDWDNLKLVTYEPNKIIYKIDASNKGWLVRIGRIWPGWEAYVNGNKVEITPYLKILPAVPIEQGDNYVEFRYNPKSFDLGVKITFISAICLFFISMIRRKTQTN